MGSRTAWAAGSSEIVIVRFHQTERAKMFRLLPIAKAPWQTNQYGRLRSVYLSGERLPDLDTVTSLIKLRASIL
jgi:hypothetical protein